MIEQQETSQNKTVPAGRQDKKTYTGRDLMEAAKEILRADDIGKKLPEAALESLSKLLAKTALKGDL